MFIPAPRLSLSRIFPEALAASANLAMRISAPQQHHRKYNSPPFRLSCWPQALMRTYPYDSLCNLVSYRYLASTLVSCRPPTGTISSRGSPKKTQSQKRLSPPSVATKVKKRLFSAMGTVTE
jgi:hypothetical protein